MAGVGTGSSIDRELAASFSSDTLSNIPVMGLDTGDAREGEREKVIKKGTYTCIRKINTTCTCTDKSYLIHVCTCTCMCTTIMYMYMYMYIYMYNNYFVVCVALLMIFSQYIR